MINSQPPSNLFERLRGTDFYALVVVLVGKKNEEEFWIRLAWSFQYFITCTSNCRRVSMRSHCFCLSNTSWVCSAENSLLIICSLSWMAASLTPSSKSRCLSFSVDTVTLLMGAISSLLDIRGNMSFTACNASIHVIRSSRVSALRWSLFVPVKIENLLSSDLLSRIEETWNLPIKLENLKTKILKINNKKNEGKKKKKNSLYKCKDWIKFLVGKKKKKKTGLNLIFY